MIQNPVSFFMFSVEVSVFYRGQLIQSVEFFDYNAGEFVEFDSAGRFPNC